MRFRPFCALWLLPAVAAAQPATDPPAPTDTTARDLGRVVVTATRDARALEDVPVPTTVLTRDEIEAQGAVRLSDLLAEQPGLAVVSTFGGEGVQLQGFDPAYTLVLVDGEPVIGREAGALDVDRLSVAGVERVEIVRGPTSSRYGSDALAGVINVITRRPEPGLHAEGAARAGTFGTSEVSAEGAYGGERGSARLRVTRYASSGYDLTPDEPGATAPSFADYAAELRADAAPGGPLTASVTARAGRERVDGRYLSGGLGLLEERGDRTEWSLAPRARLRLAPRLTADAALYTAWFATESRYATAGAPTPPDVSDLDSDFDQTMVKAEGGLSFLASARTALYAGGGVVGEGIGGTRYSGRRASRQAFGYAEWAWQPARLVDLTLSARADAHSDYAGQVSPRAALLLRPARGVRLRASVGRGFRAPDFRQRYLTFTNGAVGGYTVLGSEEIAAGLAAFEAAGVIAAYQIPADRLPTIRPERSTGANVGVEVEPVRGLTVRVNAFQNWVRDLIETRPVAIKTNGQSIFSYFNVDRIYTRGVDAGVSVDGPAGLAVSAGYQFLDTGDRDVLDRIAAGDFPTFVDGQQVRLARRDYGGLFGRSRHSGALRVEHRAARLGLTTSARLVWRGRYGDADANGSTVLDAPEEYVAGHAALNLTVTKALGPAAVQASVVNLLDETDAVRRPSDPGRRVLVGFSYRF